MNKFVIEFNSESKYRRYFACGIFSSHNHACIETARAGLSCHKNTAIKSVDNLKVGTVTTAYSNTVAAGKVISQNPAAGTKVATGSKVNYVKSLGKKPS